MILLSNIIILFFGLSACSKNKGGVQDEANSFLLPADYAKQLLVHRNEQDNYFRGPQSPLEDSIKRKFKGIVYFDIDTSYRVIADFEKIENGKVFKMEVTGTVADTYKTIGKLHFNLNNIPQVLEVYENQDLKKSGYEFYFVPFNDRTNGKETYGGGRYLDIKSIGSQKMIIDFNYAYQPYCAYNHNFSCPVPPPANKLNIEVRAGERMGDDEY